MTNLTKHTWLGEKTRLDRVLVELGTFESRNRAAEAVSAGTVSVDGKAATKPSTKIMSGQIVALTDAQTYVSRAAKKLVHGLRIFSVDPENKLCIDVGASTGGFTQVLLEKGARRVVSLDVGHGQLAETLRNDPRVEVVEGFNARNLNEEEFYRLNGARRLPELLVTDVSFISVTLLFDAFKSVTKKGADLIVLVKPQFEVGKNKIKNGVVKDIRLHQEVLETVSLKASDTGFTLKDLVRSPVVGTAGNVEYLLHMVNESSKFQTQWIEKIKTAVEEEEGTR